MYASRLISAFLLSSVVCLCPCKAGTQTITQLTTTHAAQEGKIAHGAVAGANTQPAALVKLLSMVHTNLGEEPQIGRAFRFAGANSVGVFFWVTVHLDGNLLLGGLAIASASGPNKVEAAMVYDLASRFGQTVNPMLQRLFSAWNPGGTPAAGGGRPGAGLQQLPARSDGDQEQLHRSPRRGVEFGGRCHGTGQSGQVLVCEHVRLHQGCGLLNFEEVEAIGV